jgi:hypothetical protein
LSGWSIESVAAAVLRPFSSVGTASGSTQRGGVRLPRSRQTCAGLGGGGDRVVQDARPGAVAALVDHPAALAAPASVVEVLGEKPRDRRGLMYEEPG